MEARGGQDPGYSISTLGLKTEGLRRKWAGCSLVFPLEGTREEEEDADDYENMAPPYKDLPPKPGKRNSQRLDEEICGLWAGRGAISLGGISWAL